MVKRYVTSVTAAGDVEHHHGVIGDPGNGAPLWFKTDDFDSAIARATEMGSRGHQGAPP